MKQTGKVFMALYVYYYSQSLVGLTTSRIFTFPDYKVIGMFYLTKWMNHGQELLPTGVNFRPPSFVLKYNAE